MAFRVSAWYHQNRRERVGLEVEGQHINNCHNVMASYTGFTFSLSCFLILTHKLFNYLRYFIAYTYNLGSLLSFQNFVE